MTANQFPELSSMPIDRIVPIPHTNFGLELHKIDTWWKHKDFVMLFHGGFEILRTQLDRVDAPLVTYKLFARLVWNLSRLRGRGNIVPCNVKAIAKEFAMSSQNIYVARKKLIEASIIRPFKGLVGDDDPAWMIEYRKTLVEMNPLLAFSGNKERYDKAVQRWVEERTSAEEE